MNRTIQSLLAGTALATIGFGPMVGHAQQSQEELLHRIDRLEGEIRLSKGQVQENTDNQKKAGEGSDFKVSTAGGLTIESKDGAFSGHVGGRIFVDQAFYSEDKTRLGDGAEFRTLRLDVSGKMFHDFPYKVQLDFAGNGTSIKDTFFGYGGWKPMEFVIGNYLPPISLDALVSSKYTTFMEPALPQQTLSDRRIGVQAAARGSNWSGTLALFSALAADAAPAETDSGWVLAGRFTYAPVMTKTSVVHAGIGFQDYYPNNETVRYRARPESHFTGARFIDTGGAGITNVDEHALTIQPEVAVVLGPVHAEAEYQMLNVRRGAGSPNLDFWGFYAQIGWFLTGEVRPYQIKDTPYSANFGRLKPLHNIGDGGFGAVEVAARYSALDLSDQNVRGGAERNITLGLNWYLNPFTRVMFNYVKVNNDNEALGNAANLKPGQPNGRDDDPSIFEMRAQLDF
jgi:phosphate-selective porin OprO and OprP